MALNLPLTQTDINYLTDTKENTQVQNQLIQDSIASIFPEIAKLLLIDVPFKKKLDPVHVDIFEFEEELRRLNGTSIIQPLQEKGFTISNTSGNISRLYVNNERLIITENGTEIINVPLFPVRGYSRSQYAGTNFDIWSRDRFGSTTSTKHIATSFSIDIYNKNLAVKFDNSLQVEIDLSSIITIEQTDEALFYKTTGLETSTTLLNIPVTPNTDFIRMTLDSQSYDQTLFDPTTGSETTANLLYFPVLDESETIAMVPIEGADFFDLVRGTDYTINNTSGVITFLIPILADHKMTANYQDESSFFDLVRNTDYSINYASGLISFLTPVLPNYDMTASYFNQVQLAPSAVASTIQLLLQQSDPSLENVSCIFNEVIKTITIISGYGGPTSSVEVVAASSNDLKSLLGFDSQYKIQGKFQNNLLNVEIDGQAAEIKIADFRLCFEDLTRGYNNDDIGFDWSGNLSTPLGFVGRDRVGPLFCSGISNGKDVARSIEAQLRIVGSGGFKDAMVHYFTDDKTFVIYSGTMGTDSSVHVLPASDSDRDAKILLGFSPPQEERGHELYYETLQKLFDRLAVVPNTSVSGLTVPSRFSHSILYTQLEGVNIHSDFQDFDATTTKIYDDGSRGLPRLYPDGKLTVDSTNDKIDFFENINVEKTATITHAVYENEAFVAEAIQDALNAVSGGPVYKCEYKPQPKIFTISSDIAGGKIFSILWQTGRNALQSIGNYLGYNVLIDKTGSGSYSSDRQITFHMLDYFNPFYPNQFDGSPKVPDLTVDEQSALYKEEEYLNDENTMSFVDNMLSLTAFDNEVLITAWQQLAALELAKVNQEYTAIRYHRGAYANHISETDSEIIKKTTAYNNLKPNRTNLIDNLISHARFLNIAINSNTFISGVDFTNEGSQSLSISFASGVYNKRVYNSPAPLVKFTSGPKQIPGRFSPAGLWTNSVTYTPEQLTAFRITNPNTATRGYSYTPPDLDGYVVKYAADSVATILSTNSGTYDMSAGDTLKMKIDGGTEQTATFNATPGYTESRIAVTNQFVVKLNTNDKIDFSEGLSQARTTNSIDELYSFENGDQLGISVDSGPVQWASFNATQGYQEGNAIGTSSLAIKSSFNDKLDFEEIQGTEQTITIPQGVYTGETLAVQIQTLLNSTGSSVYTVFYDSTPNKFLISSTAQFKIVAGVNNKLDFEEKDGTQISITLSAGTYTASGLATEIQNKLNSTGMSVYTVLYNAGTKKFTITSDGTLRVVTGSNDRIDFNEQTGIELTATIPSGNYSPTSLASVIQTQLNSAGSDYVVTFDNGTKKFTITSNFVYTIQTGVNDKIDFSETIGIQLTATIPAGTYTASGLVTEIQTQLNSVGADYTVTFNNVNKKFTIASNFSHVVQTGVNDRIDFSETVGVQLTATIPAGTYSSSALATEMQTQLNAAGSDYTVTFNPTTKKFTLTSNFAYIIQTGVNDKINFNEQTGIELTSTIPAGTYSSSTLASAIQTQLNSIGGDYTVTFDNGTKKFTLTSNFSYEISASNNKLDFNEQDTVQLVATIPSGTYTGTSLATAIQTQLNSVGSGYAVSYDTGAKKFTLTSDGNLKVTTGVNDRIDFNEQETIQLTSTIPAGTYTPAGLATAVQTQLNSAGGDYTVSYNVGTKKFTITSNFTYTISTSNNKIDFKEKQNTQLTSTLTSGSYTGASLATEIQNKLNSSGLSVYTVSFSSDKFTLTSDGKIKIDLGVNDALDYREVGTQDLFDLVASGTYTPAALAAQIQSDLNYSGSTGSIYTVSYSAKKFTFTSDGTILVVSGVNDKLDVGVGSEKTATLVAGRYSPSSLASHIQARLNAVSSGFSVSYSANKFTISRTSSFDLLWFSGTNSGTSIGYNIGYNMGVDNTAGTSFTANYTSGIFELPWVTGSSTITSIGTTIGFTADDTGSLSYTADNQTGILSLLWNTGSNSGTSVGSTIGFIVTSDDTGSLSYLSDNKTGIFQLLWSTGTNSSRTIGEILGFITTSDDTGSLAYTSDNKTAIFSLLWNTGSDSVTSIGSTIGFIVTSDDTGSLTYTSDNATGIFNLLWNTGSNSGTSIGTTIGFIITSDDTGSLAYTSDNATGFFSLLWNTGTNSARTIGTLIGFVITSDDTGSLAYTSDISTGFFSILWNTGTNASISIGTTIGYIITSDNTNALSYTSDNGTGLFNILWNSGSNSGRSIGNTIGYNITSDNTGSLAYTSDYSRGVFTLLWSTGSNSSISVGHLIGFNVISDDSGSLSYISDYQTIILSILWATGTNASTSVGYALAYNVGSNDTGSYSYLSDFAVEFYVPIGYSDQFTITRNSIPSTSPITITSRRYVSTVDLMSEIQTQVDSDPSFSPGDVVVSFSSNKFRLTSSSKGTGSTISTSGDFLTMISFTPVTTVNGTGGFVDITQATALEVVNVLNSYWTGVTTSVDGNRVRVKHNSFGFFDFQISDGTGNPNVQLGFLTSLIIGLGKYVITIPSGVYTGSSLASIIQSLMNSIGDSTYAVDYSSTNINRFTFVSNGLGGTNLFQLLWNTGDNASISIGYTLGFNVSSDDIGSFIYASYNQTQFSVVTGINNVFTIKIDSQTSAGNIVISQGNYLVAALITEMTTQIANDPNFDSFDFSITYPANKFRITSATMGTGSIVEVYEGTNDFLRNVCLDADAPVYGGIDVVNIDAVTVDEVAAVLNSEITGISASNDGNKVRITTLSLKGSLSTIEITGGTCRTVVGFNLGLINGVDQDNKLKVNIDSDETKDPIEVATNVSVPISGLTMASSIQALLRSIVSGGYTLSNCTFNESTAFQVFNNSLRIISGTYGSSSTVFVSDKTIKIITGVNNKINFQESIGVELTATLTAGFFNATTLEQEIKTQLESVGVNIYTVTYSIATRKLTISSNGAFFSLLFGSGTNAVQSVADIIAFYSVDHTGSLSYSSNGFVKLRSCYKELGFNSQTTQPGHDLDSIKININDTRMTSYIYWLDHGGGNRIDLDIDLTVVPTNNISGLISSINSHTQYDTAYRYDVKHDYAYLLGIVSGDFNIEDNDSLVVNANNTGNQIVTFIAKKATSVSGSNAWTRIFSGSSDRLRLRFDSLSSEVNVSNESLMGGIAIGGEQNFTANNTPIKAGSSTITLTRLLPIPFPVTLNEGSDYSVNYGTGQVHLNSGLITGDFNVKIHYTYYSGTYEIVIGTQLTPEAIAAKIQQEVRALIHSNIEAQSTFSEFTCEFVGGKYVLTTGNGGTDSKLHVYDCSVNSAAPYLKLGADYGGIETEGSGDVVNSNFVTITEIINKLNSVLTGVVASGPNYVKLTSSVLGDSTRIYISPCALSSKLGFDIGTNNDSYPFVDLANVSSTTIKNIVNQEIQSPTIFTVLRGWETQKGNVNIIYYTCDNQNLLERKNIIADRLTFIPTRKMQIPIRVASIVFQLVPSLYNPRKDKVKIRLNKKTGTYVKVGDKLGQQESNQSAIDTNNEFISAINSILP